MTRRPHLLQPLHAWLLAALLLAAQALGLAHRVAHAPGLPGPVVAHAMAFSAAGPHAHSHGRADDHAHAHAHHEAGSPDCQLIDQLAHADALCGSTSLSPALPRGGAIGAAAAVPVLPHGSAAAYLARGPPASA